jgi:hypothetical protein
VVVVRRSESGGEAAGRVTTRESGSLRSGLAALVDDVGLRGSARSVSRDGGEGVSFLSSTERMPTSSVPQ